MLTEKEAKTEVKKTLERWSDRIQKFGKNDKELHISCTDKFGNNFPILEISRTEKNIKNDEFYESWRPHEEEIKEEIMVVGVCNYADDSGQFSISKKIKISENTVDEIVQILLPLIDASNKNITLMQSVQDNMSRSTGY